MRPPTRITAHPGNPYEELAQLADPEPDFGEPELGDPDFREPGFGGSCTGERGGPPGLALPSDDDPEDWAPPNHRGRSRFAAVPVALKLTVGAMVCATLLTVCDRLAVNYAEEKAEEKIQDSLGLAARPDVDIAGFPFLTQVLDHRIDRADITLPDVAADKVSLAEVHATAEDIRIVGDLPTALQGAVVDRMDGDVLLSFDDLNRELGASHVKFSNAGPRGVHIAGSLPVAGRGIAVRAEARIEQDGQRAVSTTVENMRLDVPGLFTYRPGKDPAHSGLRLHREAATRISREAARAKALLDLPAVVKRLGIPLSQIDRALRSEKELNRLTGTPRFLQQLMKVNLLDVVVDHPWLLEKAGIDPRLIGGLLKLRPPQLSDRLSLSFELPKTPAGDIRLKGIVVEREGIRADLTGTGLAFGNGHGADGRRDGG
ncbi:LmeA family phospholipid-binding protein [Streptomyces sp. NBC_00259]|uniref:LmeA family phospholipid-binding protein n=1 Tax=Streptomyces sp. NBC_00259 TaxID=2903643 RepID=UPI002E2C4825|nr:DUF2993 domain-containing protein [Streptomyces sp. NBC_00259]